MVKYLKEQGSDINTGATGDGSLICGAATGGYLEVVKYLKEQGADVNAGTTGYETPIWTAAAHDHFEVVKYLIDNGGKESDIGECYNKKYAKWLVLNNLNLQEICKEFIKREFGKEKIQQLPETEIPEYVKMFLLKE
ncbi:hypothetical protein CI610_03505 [invertebrate metagenome]|uniref:Uncharacterized protein n=1 Tax=invertebrate metagenome TaxID=1711999 RepID=A0A2H9T2W9_9ZZZZ